MTGKMFKLNNLELKLLAIILLYILQKIGILEASSTSKVMQIKYSLRECSEKSSLLCNQMLVLSELSESGTQQISLRIGTA